MSLQDPRCTKEHLASGVWKRVMSRRCLATVLAYQWQL